MKTSPNGPAPENPFNLLSIGVRGAKPRDRGITMMIDWGIPLGLQGEVIATAGHAIDLAKIAVGISAVLPGDILRSKIVAYQQAGIEPFPGGMFLEYAHALRQTAPYFDACDQAGFRLVEVSDNAIAIAPDEKVALITASVQRGFRVLGEVGSKHDLTEESALVEDILRCLDAGAWKVFIEAAELFEGGRLRHTLLEAITARVDQAAIMWELPGTWIDGIHAHEIHALQVLLIESYGPDVNMANVDHSAILSLETLRRGIGVRTLVDGLTPAVTAGS